MTSILLSLLSMCSYPTYEEWKRDCFDVLIIDFPYVLILPMRNGNSHSLSKSNLSLFCSYPTYEEWKLSKKLLFQLFLIGSYPTYEEWKPFTLSI